MSLAFQFLDLVVVVIVVASAIYATYRGLVSESLAIFGWVAAAYATLYFGPWVAWWMQDMLSPRWLGQAAGYLLVFLVVLIPLHFASSRISQNIKQTQVGTLDSVLGTGFGILRGFAIVGILYLIFTAWVPFRSQPYWVVEAKLFPVIRASAEVVASLIPDQSIRAPGLAKEPDDPIAEKLREPADPIAEKLRETDRKASRPRHYTEPAPAAAPRPAKPKAAKPVKKTYGAKDRHALDRLIETNTSDESGKQ